MTIATTIWLVLFGALLVSTFSLGTYYLSQWKDGLMKVAKHSARLEHTVENDRISNSTYEELAESQVCAKISLPIWITSFIITFGSLVGVVILLIGMN